MDIWLANLFVGRLELHDVAFPSYCIGLDVRIADDFLHSVICCTVLLVGRRMGCLYNPVEAAKAGAGIIIWFDWHTCVLSSGKVCM